MPQPQGFTVVESLVALTLIGVGVAAWMATATLSVSLAASAEQATRGAYAARNRAEHLASLPCASLTDGSDGTVRWMVHAYPGGMRLIATESPYGSGSRAGVARYAILVAC
jgi:prepilin-type N-terminal cleavage/methylation domain-containing protein